MSLADMESPRHTDDIVVRTNRGRWSEPGLPHKGWTCTGMEDLGPEDEGGWITCEMCQCMAVRYAHSMEHPDYGGTIVAGCVCAGNMEEDPIAAQLREAGLRGRRGDWFRRVAGYDDVTNFTGWDVGPIHFANTLPEARNSFAFRGLVICRAQDRADTEKHPGDGWAERIRQWSTIRNTQISLVSNTHRGVPPTDSSIHWTIMSWNTARSPAIYKAVAANRYDLFVLDQVPAFNVGATIGHAPNVVTIREGECRFYQWGG